MIRKLEAVGRKTLPVIVTDELLKGISHGTAEAGTRRLRTGFSPVF
jgi:hypothetical protein